MIINIDGPEDGLQHIGAKVEEAHRGAPGTAELEQIEARVMLLPVRQRLAFAGRLLSGDWPRSAMVNPADRLLEHLRELAASTDRLPLNRELEALPSMRGQNVSSLLTRLRRQGVIEMSFPCRDNLVRLFRLRD